MGAGENEGGEKWQMDEWKVHISTMLSGQLETACLELDGDGSWTGSEPGDLSKESSSSRQQAWALAGLILVKDKVCVE